MPPKAKPRSFSAPILLLPLISILLLAYFNTFSGPFIFDDRHLVTENRGIKQLDDIYLAMAYDTPSRPVMMLSFAVNYYFGGLRVFGYHIANLLLHSFSCLLLFALILRTPYRIQARGKISFAMLASLLFAIHPVYTEAVTYISSRSELLCAFFYLLAFYFFLGFRLSRNSRKKKILYLLALICYFLAFWAKEIAITFLAVIILHDFFFFHQGTNKRMQGMGLSGQIISFLKERGLHHLPFLLEAVLFFIMRYFYLGEVLEKDSSFVQTYGRMAYFLTQCRVVPFYYVRKFFTPFNLNFEPDYPVAQSFFALSTVVYLISSLLLIATPFLILKKNKAAAFFLFFFLIALTPTSSIVPILDVAVEHRLYLPGVGLVLLAACLCSACAGFRGRKMHQVFWTPVVLLLPPLLLSIGCIKRNSAYRSPEAIWEDTIAKSPHRARPYFGLGYYYYEAGEKQKALLFYKKALSIKPDYPDLHMAFGEFYKKEGLLDLAREHAEIAVALDPKYAFYHNLLGDIYQRKGLHEKSAEEFMQTIRLKPLYPPGHYNLGNYYAGKGEYKKAAELYRKALSLDRSFVEAQKNLELAESLF